MAGRIGLLLLNLGSPDAPTGSAVRRYLREFLSDPRVIDIPAPARKLLLEAVILPTRPRKSAAAYAKIWTDEGSPLIIFTERLAERLQSELDQAAPGTFRVRHAMRYGQPSIKSALASFTEEGVEYIRAWPQYPQYSASASGSVIEELYRVAGAAWNTPRLDVLPLFFEDDFFIDALARRARETAGALEADHLLFSFHGLPERQIRKSDPRAHCLNAADCCDHPGDSLTFCYRAQCYRTARATAARLGLQPDAWSTAFQSRLGRTPWIRPYTDKVLTELPARGVRRLAVMCPSFTVDCLETLEEINIRAREDFLAAGGEELIYIPCLNDEPYWVKTMAEKIMGL